MQTLTLQLPSEISLEIGYMYSSAQFPSVDEIEHLPMPASGEAIAWRLHSNDLIGLSLFNGQIAFYRQKLRRISLGILYPAKGSGSVSISLKSDDGFCDIVVSPGYEKTIEQWFASILDSLASFYGIPSGEPETAYDC